MFATTLLGFFDRNEVICRQAGRIDLSANDLWDLDLRIDWQGIGQVDIRNAVPDDVPALKKFLLEGLSDHSRFLFAPYPYKGDLDSVLDCLIAESSNKTFLIYHAWHEGHIIGHFFLANMSRPVADLGIAVADDFHGKKLGNLFMTLLVAAGHFAGKDAIELTTNPQNHAGFHLYQKIGFVYVGDREITVADGTRRIEHELVYRIRQPAQ